MATRHPKMLQIPLFAISGKRWDARGIEAVIFRRSREVEDFTVRSRDTNEVSIDVGGIGLINFGRKPARPLGRNTSQQLCPDRPGLFRQCFL